MPDIFVPIDTSDFSNYYGEIRNRGLIYKYSLEYADQNREKLNAMKSVDETLDMLNKDNVLRKFISFASNNGVKFNKKQFEISKKIIDTQLKAYIVRNIFDNEGFYPVIEKIDKTLQVAIDELKKGVHLTTTKN